MRAFPTRPPSSLPRGAPRRCSPRRSLLRRLLHLVLLLPALGPWACGGERPSSTGDLDRERAAEVVLARTEGLTHLERDELDEAEADFLRVVELVPEESLGYRNLAVVHLRRGDVAEAERLAREAVERSPEDAEALLTLARVHEVAGDEERAREVLEEALEASPDHLRLLWALAELAADGVDSETPGPRPGLERRAELIGRIVEVAPGNHAAPVHLAGTELLLGRFDSATHRLDRLRRSLPGMPGPIEEALDRTIETLRGDDEAAALGAFRRFLDLVRSTAPYQDALGEVRGPAGEMVGIPSLSFSHELTLRIQETDAVVEALRLRDATDDAGLAAAGRRAAGDVGDDPSRAPDAESTDPFAGAPVVALADWDGDGDEDLWVGPARADGASSMLLDELGLFVEADPARLPAGGRLGRLGDVTDAAPADVDNDGHLDLVVIGTGGTALWRNDGTGSLVDATGAAGLEAAGGGRVVLAADLDHDGDLDLFLGGSGPDRFWRNDGDGSFTERGAEAGLDGPAEELTTGAAFGDLDDDGDLDLVVTREGGVSLFSNARGGRFDDVAEAAGLASTPGADGLEIGDFDHDGRLDLLLLRDGGPSLLRNAGGTFSTPESADAFPPAGAGGLPAVPAADAAVFDVDNDGHLDVLLVGTGDGAGARLLRGDGSGRFTDLSAKLPEGLADRLAAGREAVAVTFDYNDDGDLDVLLGSPTGPALLRNDGGNASHFMKVSLRGLLDGSRKNNRFGIGSRVEVRAGDLYQVRVVTGPEVHLGLGERLKPDVVRIEWTNGVPQTLYFPGTDADLESQVLKGSCPFLYTWDGGEWVFAKDVMWRSALGMPTGILGGGGRSYAPAGASHEYVRIPGELLRPDDGRYRLRLTEELWEAAYVDEVKLVTLDHPDSVDIYVDERFVPPPAPPPLRVFPVARARSALRAADGAGHDLRGALAEADHVYADHLSPGPYQGVAEPHELLLDFGDLGPCATAEDADCRIGPHLFLRGWIFPTDASINVAMAQSDAVRARPPELWVPGPEGEWVRTDARVGVPSGKDKVVIVDLAGLFPTGDHRILLRTNLELYWDRAFVADVEPVEIATGAPPVRWGGPGEGEADGATDGRPPLRLRTLHAETAELRYRGFSRMYRKGGPGGPHWFDYDDIDPAPRWRKLSGAYTRFGDVASLLLSPDDRYAVMDSGDEIAISFPAGDAGEPPTGWRRDFLLYSVGWVKDGDLNTATGGTVEPLPFHGMTGYPYGPGEAYPDDEEHRRFREEYLTRRVIDGGR